ncbi:GNAT family acetyltransferase [Glutamicibacter arilaitensis]|uniref:GNAT family acetyltransferase n=1 Tax=Glutamicibacter arilaitensis TaxID=256701 RepID=UPI003F9A3544
MQITELSEKYLHQAVDLWETTGLTRPWNDPLADARRALREPNSTVLAMIENNQVVGTAMTGHDGHRGWLYYVAVDPRRQGNGLGRSLVDAASRWLRERAVPKVQLMVRSENAAVIDFYEPLGFEDQQVVVLGRRLDQSEARAGKERRRGRHCPRLREFIFELLTAPRCRTRFQRLPT